MNPLHPTLGILILAALGTACIVKNNTPPEDNGGSSSSSSGGGGDVLPIPDGSWGAYPIDESGCAASTGPGDDETAPPCDGETVLCVDASASGGDGTSGAPFATISAAIAAADDGDAVHVAAGSYDENLVIRDKSVRLLGGFDAAFTSRNPAARATCVHGGQRDAVIALIEAGASVVDGFNIAGGAAYSGDEFYQTGAGIYLDGGDVSIRHNVIENNRVSGDLDSSTGGGIQVFNGSPTIERNHIRQNIAGKGGAIATSESPALINHNTIQDNHGLGDHGGALYLSGNVTVSNNVVSNNTIGREAGYGWGGGMIVFGETTVATIGGNVFSGNSAPLVGGAVFFDEAARGTMTGDLIYKNHVRGEDTRPCGAALYVDGTQERQGSHVTIVNATIADNTCEDSTEGIAAYVEAGSSLTMRNSIVWGHAHDVAVDSSSSFDASYSFVGAEAVDPRFVGDDDYRLQLGSPAIDGGDPADAFDREPSPNGGRINLGAFGNTPLATPKSQ